MAPASLVYECGEGSTSAFFLRYLGAGRVDPLSALARNAEPFAVSRAPCMSS